MLGLLLGAIEATAVAAAMPTIVGELGGVARYSWVFSAYLVASTATVPLYGKLADRHGRRLLYAIAVGLFCLGSALSGAAQSMPQLIAFRALQGLGAGGVFPVTITVIGDIFDLEERSRMQGLFAGVWGVSSLVGPFLGGVVTDAFSWRWIFYVNVPFGLLSAAILAAFLVERPATREHRLDLVGVAALVSSVTLLLVGLLEGGGLWGWDDPRTIGCLAAAALIGSVFVARERRAPDPMLPVDLLRTRLVGLATALSAGIGAIIYTTSAFVPMFGQGVLMGTAIDAGLLLAPASIGWPLASTVAGRLLLRIGYRPLLVTGGVVATAGAGLLALAIATAESRAPVMAAMLVVGVGLGLVNTPQLVAVQSAVGWRVRGAATSALQFFRSIGGAIAVALFGAVLNRRLGAALAGEGVALADAEAILDPAIRAGLGEGVAEALARALRFGIEPIFLAVGGLGVVLFLCALAFPRGSARSLAAPDEATGGGR